MYQRFSCLKKISWQFWFFFTNHFKDFEVNFLIKRIFNCNRVKNNVFVDLKKDLYLDNLLEFQKTHDLVLKSAQGSSHKFIYLL